MNISEITSSLVARRKDRGLTQEQLASLAKLRREWISRFENGTHDIGLRRLVRLCEALNLEISIRPGAGRPHAADVDEIFKDEA